MYYISLSFGDRKDDSGKETQIDTFPERLSGKERRKPEMTFQEQIKDRLENGFQHWNNGYGEPVEFIASLIESVAGGDFLKKNKGNFC
jgi:hypothetical protein